MIYLDEFACCPLCGGTIDVREQPSTPPSWWLECLKCSFEDLTIEKPTYRAMPGFAPLVAEIERLKEEAAMYRAILTVPEVYVGRVQEAVAEELERLRAELTDARRALAMARGEEWPAGWERRGLTWWSPSGDSRIYYGEDFTQHGTAPMWVLEWISTRISSYHGDALAALRAYQR